MTTETATRSVAQKPTEKANSITPKVAWLSSRKAHTIIEVVVLACAFIFYACWATHLPHDMAPDEAMRFDVPFYIYYFGSLPLGDDPSIRNPLWGFSYAYTAYGSSLLAIPLMQLMSLFSTAPAHLLIAARFTDVIIGTITVFVCFRIGKIVFPYNFSASVVLAIFVGFLPQYAFISSYFNIDAMSILGVALVTYFLLYGKKKSWNFPSLIFLGLSIGFLALSYYFAYGAIVAAILYYYWDCLRDSKKRTLMYLLIKPLVVFACAFAVAGWFFVRNAILYDGDFFGLNAREAAGELYAAKEFKADNRVTPKSTGCSLLGMVFATWSGSPSNWLSLTTESAIALFGYMNVFVPPYIIFAYALIFAVGIVLAVIAFLMLPREKKIQLLPLIVAFLIMILLPIVFSAYHSWSYGFQAQGRYIISGIVPFCIISVWGYEQLAQGITRLKHTHEQRDEEVVRSNRALFIVLIVAWFILLAAVLYLAILPSCLGGVGEVAPLVLSSL